jgi:hypothetical protein
VKHSKIIFNTLRGGLTGLFLLCLTTVFAQQAPASVEPVEDVNMDSVEISLLTCEPHDEVYSLYGHTAIRYHDKRHGGLDAAFNYGVFDFRKPFFALRFVFGITDYELGVYPYRLFKKEYEYFGSEVTEQVINLTDEEKLQLRLALAENMLPENTVYRYNFFYNNCTTKARDIIEKCINGRIEYFGYKEDTISYREAVHVMTADYPWARFGNDLLLGIQADQPTTTRQQEFLPGHLMREFRNAVNHAEDGTTRPLVQEERIAVPAGTPVVQSGFPLSPLACGFVILGIGILLFVIEFRNKRAFLLWDILLMVGTGVLGIVLFLMVFSEHPTVSINLQLLLFNPLPWFFLWPVIKRRQTRYWQVTFVLFFLFMIGSLFQHYAEGLWCLALCLLLQSYIHIFRNSQ